MPGPSVQPEVSVVIPCFNEEGNLRELHRSVAVALDPTGVPWELVVTDDCSRDGSWALLKTMSAEDPRVVGLKLDRNRGQSAAMWAGMKAARGAVLITLDADLQNDPSDLPRFIEAMKTGIDCVCGTRVKVRSDGDGFVKVVSSRIANWVRNRLSGEQVADAGCCYRAFKRECIADLKFFKGMHRFMPTLFRIEGFTVMEIDVGHNPRFAGRSNYGVWNRLFASFYDLLAVRWMKRRMFRFRVAERTD